MKQCILCLVFFCMVGCSKPKTLSGVFIDSSSNAGVHDEQKFDFRTDGTVIYTSRYDTGNVVLTHNGNGTYSINDGLVTAKLSYTSQISGSQPEQKTSEWVFRVEGEDLLTMSRNGKTSANPHRNVRRK